MLPQPACLDRLRAFRNKIKYFISFPVSLALSCCKAVDKLPPPCVLDRPFGVSVVGDVWVVLPEYEHAFILTQTLQPLLLRKMMAMMRYCCCYPGQALAQLQEGDPETPEATEAAQALALENESLQTRLTQVMKRFLFVLLMYG